MARANATESSGRRVWFTKDLSARTGSRRGFEAGNLLYQQHYKRCAVEATVWRHEKLRCGA